MEHEDPTPAIQDCMRKLDRLGIPKNYRQVGIMFAQVGMDQAATQHLKSLDDMSTHRDIVDTFESNMTHIQQWTDDDWNYIVVKLLLGAIDRGTDMQQQQQPVASSSAGPNGQQPPSYSGGTTYSNYWKK